MDKSERRKQYWFVIRQLTSREMKRKYARSKLGVLWSILSPLLNMIVISLVFTQMFERAIENYPVYYICGNIIWSFFTVSTNTALTSLVDNKNMLIKVKFPMDIFVISRITTAFVNFLYTLIPFVLVLCVFRIRPHFTLFFFPVIIFCLLLFSTGISYILAVVYVFFGDIKHLYSVILTLWMFLSAIFYPASSLPDYMQTVIGFNPMFLYIDALRDIVMYGTLPEPVNVIKMFAFAVGFFFIGLWIFKANKAKIMQKI